MKESKQVDNCHKQSKKQTNLRAILLSITLTMVCSTSIAQITVDTNGKVGLHCLTTSSEADVLINGTTRIINSSGTVLNFWSDYGYSPVITSANANTGKVGTESLPFAEVWGYNIKGSNLWCNYTTLHASDERIKENIRGIDSPLEKILQVIGKKYDYIPDMFDSVGTEQEKQKKTELKKDKLGFIAQDLEIIIPEAVFFDVEMDRYYIEYNAIIPVIVEAMKEQQAMIEELKEEIETLKGKSNEKSATITTNVLEDISNSPLLGQNIPNPFNTSTRIDIYLPNTVLAAYLYIYNMQGTQVKSFNINERGNTSITIEGNSLEAGMYLYTLIADSREVDTKKMILTK